ncbi:hypothetical protein [Streptomyces sp. SCL15-4]|uniref:hypothetical protein n=1 Tax=Streptomyces sp. SCL15-4 TaxID=2967221 RepID=UPI00296741A6|nr:hypothetical protein [Streptomyces sp. SCL15-4]
MGERGEEHSPLLLGPGADREDAAPDGTAAANTAGPESGVRGRKAQLGRPVAGRVDDLRPLVPARHGGLVRLGKALVWYDGMSLTGQDRLLTDRPRPPPPDRPPVIPALAWT